MILDLDLYSPGGLEAGGLEALGPPIVDLDLYSPWGLEAGGLEARATDFGSGSAHACPEEEIMRTLQSEIVV